MSDEASTIIQGYLKRMQDEYENFNTVYNDLLTKLNLAQTEYTKENGQFKKLLTDESNLVTIYSSSTRQNFDTEFEKVQNAAQAKILNISQVPEELDEFIKLANLDLEGVRNQLNEISQNVSAIKDEANAQIDSINRELPKVTEAGQKAIEDMNKVVNQVTASGQTLQQQINDLDLRLSGIVNNQANISKDITAIQETNKAINASQEALLKLIDKTDDHIDQINQQIGDLGKIRTDIDTLEINKADKTFVTEQLAKTAKKLKTISLNLADYADFNSLAHLADITSIVESALSNLPSIIEGYEGWRLFNVSVFIPGGRWTISKKRVFDLTNYGSFPSVRGFNLHGAGYENTEIVFDSNISDEDNFLIYNNDKYGYSEIKDIRFTAKNNVEKFMFSTVAASGNAASIMYKNIVIKGFQMGIQFNGSIMCSEIDYYSIKIIDVPVGGIGILVDNPQSVNHNFYGCDFEVIYGTALQFKRGGCANVFGGSMIAFDGGVILRTTDNSGSGIGTNNNTFNFYGIRTELSGLSKVFDVRSYVELTFTGCNLTVEKSSGGAIRGILGPNASYVTFRDCNNSYRYQVTTNESAYVNGACRVLFDNCTLREQLSALVSVSPLVNQAGLPLITAVNTRNKHSTSDNIGQIIDSTLNKERSNVNAVVPVKTVFVRTGTDYNGGLPNNNGHSFKLPLESIITKIRIVHNPSNVVGSFGYKVVNDDETVVFAEMSPTAHSSSVTVSSEDLWYRVDTEDKRGLKIVQTGTNSTQSGYIVVDYI